MALCSLAYVQTGHHGAACADGVSTGLNGLKHSASGTQHGKAAHFRLSAQPR